ncbi:MAG TPA: BtrH N-terminal domain-containing protein [Longilinea sp.]|nr:BtrH N-terminal domain-containing protein [Longilinea sp.]
MPIINLPHTVTDFTCPVKGIEDMYEWKTGVRLPDYFLMPLSMIGFTNIKQKAAPAPRMVFWSTATGKLQHTFLGEVIGYRWTCMEGKGYKTTLQAVKVCIDGGVPVMLGLLDMYHLPYYPKFYHHFHIPQHYVLMVGYDDRKEEIYVLDNGLPEVQAIPYIDLQAAWDVHSPGLGEKNTFFWLDFNPKIATQEEIARVGLKKRAQMFLNPPLKFMGLPGLKKFAAEFPHWDAELTPQGLHESLMHLVTFTCSMVPMPPQRLLPYPIGHVDHHQATRDRFAELLSDLARQYHIPAWEQAAVSFRESGRYIQELTDTICDHLQSGLLDTHKIELAIDKIVIWEEKGFINLLG